MNKIKSRREKRFSVLLTIVMVLVMVITVYPVWYSLINSLNSAQDLSLIHIYRVSVMRCILDGEEMEETFRITEYEEACEPLFEKIRGPVKRSLSDAGIRLSQIDEVVLRCV